MAGDVRPQPLFQVEQNLDTWWESAEWQWVKHISLVCPVCGQNLSFIGKDSLNRAWFYCFNCRHIEI